MNIGDRIRVSESVIVYHHPKNRNQPLDLKGKEGLVVDMIKEWQGRPVSANLPVLVQFEDKFKAHFRLDELEAL